MEYTPTVGLKKPSQNDFYNVNDMNYNSDKIDSAFDKALRIEHHVGGERFSTLANGAIMIMAYPSAGSSSYPIYLKNDQNQTISTIYVNSAMSNVQRPIIMLNPNGGNVKIEGIGDPSFPLNEIEVISSMDRYTNAILYHQYCIQQDI